MRLRNWLLTGTSLGLLALAPIGAAKAQDIATAYQAFVDAQASGDAEAIAAAEVAFNEQCIVEGYASIEECLAAIGGGAPAVESEPAVEEPMAEEPVPEEPAAEEPLPEEPVAEEPVPEPVAEEPVPEVIVEEPVAEEPLAEPVVEEPIAEEPVAEEPVAEEPAAEEPVAEEPMTEAPADSDIGAALQAQVELYDAAVADLMAGGDATAAQAQIADAKSEIDALCASAGFGSTDECLAAYGLQLPLVPGLDEPVVEPQPEEPAAEGEPLTDGEPTLETPPAEPIEEITDLPEGVTEEDVAPLLDSAKDEETAGEAGAPAPEPEPAPEGEPAPAPTSDAEAQSEVTMEPEAIAPVAEEPGEEITAAEAAEPQPELPPEVTIVDQTNNSFVFQIGAQIFINNVFQDNGRLSYDDENEIYYERLPGGRIRETIERPDGTLIVTVRDRNGNILRRSRITPDGREYILAYFDERYQDDLIFFRDPGDDLPPLRLTITVREYVLDAEDADEREVEIFFAQPPVEQVRRLYSIDEVKRSARIRDSVRRLEVGGLTFDSGKATISRDQVGSLSKVAAAMLALLADNPAETFLIEGHTDAVGTDLSNLRLSDMRAATVARILTDFYEIPPENLATQGYGERYLKVKTEDDERLNRRVTIRRITPLITPLVAG